MKEGFRDVVSEERSASVLRVGLSSTWDCVLAAVRYPALVVLLCYRFDSLPGTGDHGNCALAAKSRTAHTVHRRAFAPVLVFVFN